MHYSKASLGIFERVYDMDFRGSQFEWKMVHWGSAQELKAQKFQVNSVVDREGKKRSSPSNKRKKFVKIVLLYLPNIWTSEEKKTKGRQFWKYSNFSLQNGALGSAPEWIVIDWTKRCKIEYYCLFKTWLYVRRYKFSWILF